MSELPIGKQISLSGHFDVPVILEAARPLGKGFECRVRLPDGSLDEAVITAEEATALAGAAATVGSATTCEIHGGMNPHERKRAQEDF
jgi:hypothetical protein